MREVTSIGAENLIDGLGCEVCKCGRYEWDQTGMEDFELSCANCKREPPASMLYAYRWKALAKKLREDLDYAQTKREANNLEALVAYGKVLQFRHELSCVRGRLGESEADNQTYQNRIANLQRRLDEQEKWYENDDQKEWYVNELYHLKARITELEEGQPDIALSTSQFLHIMDTPQDE